MLAFNHILSSQRIAIERAFGVLIRRWGILWRPISFSLCKVAKIVRVCAMLHNICVDRWVINNPSRFGRGLQHWPEAPPQWGTDDLSPADDEIIERLHNNYVTAKARSSDCSARDQLMEEIYELGLSAVRDTEFNPVK
jgi:DDE superfamily endonuclease